jgi:very-short-patch-repair endonuclease
MRREPTDAEAAMWRLLRDRRLSAFKFRRQVPFRTYILDFVCFEKRLVIEIDGSQHADSQSDATREAALAAEGTTMCCSSPWRYWRTSLQSLPGGKIPLTRRLTS